MGSRACPARRRRWSVACVAAAALALAAPTAQAASDADTVLDEALSLLGPEAAREPALAADKPDGREATLLLRDLALGLDALTPERRRLAERLLARPTDRNDSLRAYRSKARRVCDTRICFWWVAKGADAPPLADRNRNRVPDWVEKTRAVFRKVWSIEVGSFGYRKPLSDLRSRNHGPNGKLDVYLADVGSRGIYGYCTSDDPRRTRARAVSAYCVVDDDFSSRQFGRATSGRKALEVTAAHEFFHAVQFAYDWVEDRWLMEGTASWIEDEVYPSINDNLQYLRSSPVGRDLFWLPIDLWQPDSGRPEAGYVYGTWILWRHLSERFGRNAVRDVWNGARGDAYAVQALSAALAARGTSFRDFLAGFGVANVTLPASYAEGALYAARPGVGPVPTSTFTLSAGVPVTPAPIQMPHMANDYYAFQPGGGLLPTSTLSIEVSLPGGSGAAHVLVRRADGTTATVPIPVDPSGVGAVNGLEFGLGSVAGAVLVLTNAGTRFHRCGEDFTAPFFTCNGFSLDDANYTIRATASP